jgi:hypothetical protein
MGANTFHLRNQSLALESLKDQLGFLVTIILGGDSFIHKKNRPRNQSRIATTPRSAREGATIIMNNIKQIRKGMMVSRSNYGGES